MIKVKQNIIVNEPYDNDPDVYHKKTRFYISTTKEFTDETTEVTELVQNDDKTLNILSKTFTFDFTNPNARYYVKTQTELSNGDTDGFSAMSTVTRIGIREGYSYSDTIITTPVVELLSTNLSAEYPKEFKISEPVIYSGKGVYTSTSFRLINGNKVIYERANDTNGLLSFTIPSNLIKPNNDYRFEVKHNYGLSESLWGGVHFLTTGRETTDFDLVLSKHPAIGKLSTFGYNFIEISTNRLDLIDFSFTLSEYNDKNNIVVATEQTTVKPEMPKNKPTIVIKGSVLQPNTKYRLTVRVIFQGTISTRDFIIFSTDNKNIALNLLDRPATNTIFKADDILQNVKNNVCYNSRKVQFSLINSVIKRFYRIGGDFQSTISDEFDTGFLDDYVTEVLIKDNALYLLGTEEVQQGSAGVSHILKLKVYSFDTVNERIYIPTSPLALFNLSDNYNKNVGNGISLYVKDKCFVTGTGEHPTINKLNLITGEIVKTSLPDDMVEILSTPLCTSLDNVNLLVGDTGLGIINKESNYFNRLDSFDGDIDFNRWVELVTTANGEIYLVGLDTREEGDELIVFYKFSKQAMRFNLVKVEDIPKDNDTSVLTRPNIILTDSGYLGLTYPAETIWFI